MSSIEDLEPCRLQEAHGRKNPGTARPPRDASLLHLAPPRSTLPLVPAAAEGILLLDLSSTSWHVVYANDVRHA